MITVIGSLKGGSGKSTVTFNLALWLALGGREPRLYDLDPQCTLSDALEVRHEEGFEPMLSAQTSYQPGEEEAAFSGETLIDVGTANMAGLKKAISRADRVLIPVAPSQADIWSTQRFLYLIASALKPGNKPPNIIAFLNRADTNPVIRESNEAHEVLNTLPGIEVLAIRLGQRTAYRRSFSEGLAVFELEPNGKAAEEFNTLAKALYPQTLKE